MPKYRYLMSELLDRGIAGSQNLFQPAIAPRGILALAHHVDYVRQVATCSVPFHIERDIGFAVDRRVARRARLAVSGTLLASRLALVHGIACNAAGGSHHARFEQGAGFCTFNDVAIAASALLAGGEAGCVAVVDCDVHQGDGTARIFENEPRVFTLSLHAARNYPVRKQRSSLDIELPDGLGDADYLAVLKAALPKTTERNRPDIVFYNAGVDPHQEDRLGRLALSDAGLRARDRMVIGYFRARSIPICGVIGGGYSGDMVALARRHAILFEVATEFS